MSSQPEELYRQEKRNEGEKCKAPRRLCCPGKRPVDLVLSCVDNYAARITISQACNEAGEAGQIEINDSTHD